MKVIHFLLFPIALLAAHRRPATSLTVAERQAAYEVARDQISNLLKAPYTAHFATIDQAVFSTGSDNTIDVRLNVDAQNSYGAMLRNAWKCRVWPQREDGLYPALCEEGLGLGGIPKDRVVGLRTYGPEVRPDPAQSAAKLTGERLPMIGIRSNPSGALVEIDSIPIGNTPVDTLVQPGEHALKVMKSGYQTWTQKLLVEPKKAQAVAVALMAEK